MAVRRCEVALGSEVGSATGGAAMGAFHGDAQRLHEKAVFFAVLAAENDIALRKPAHDGEPRIGSIFMHFERDPFFAAPTAAYVQQTRRRRL